MNHQENFPEVIILAGGQGSRLAPAIGTLPKCLAPICGRPFLDYLLVHLSTSGFKRFIFALGYGATSVETYLIEKFSAKTGLSSDATWDISLETAPLGTGGAILSALEQCHNKQVLAVNGDSLLLHQPLKTLPFHEASGAAVTLHTVKVEDAGRFGSVITDSDGRVLDFAEKTNTATPGNVNAGMYWINVPMVLSLPLPESFSWEQAVLENPEYRPYLRAVSADAYFTDIGTPESYRDAAAAIQTHFPTLVS